MLQPVPDRKAIERLLDVYKSIHYFELERSEKITARTPIIFGIYSVLLGGIAFILNDFPRMPEVWSYQASVPYALFWLAFVAEIILIGYSCTWTYKFMFVDGYSFIDPMDLHSPFYGLDIQSDKPEVDDADVVNFLLKRYMQTGRQNLSKNANRSTYYGNMLRLQAVTIVLAIFCLIAYFAVKFNEKPHTEVPGHEFRYVEVNPMFRLFRLFRKEENHRPNSEQRKQETESYNPADDPYEPYITDDRGILVIRNGQTYEEAVAFREKRRAWKKLRQM